MQSRGLNESPSDDRTDRVTNRRYFDPCNAATAELYRRDLSNHYRSVGIGRQRQRSSGLTSAAADSSNRGRVLGLRKQPFPPLIVVLAFECGAGTLVVRATFPGE